MEKKHLRQKLKKCLDNIAAEQRTEKSKKACQALIATPQFQDASVVMMYLSMPQEIDTAEAILHAWQHGKVVVVPKIFWKDGHMLPVQVHSMEADFSVGVSGLRNPVKGEPMPFEEIDLVVAPGLGFDRKGNRLGRGGGYYDKFFAHHQLKAQKCGFAFAEQMVENVPVNEHDEPVDLLVTDAEVIYLNNNHK